ncbi:hypothetical protein GCM10009087_18680 [Sphingomonas oligophenolica]|uniref:PepSY domain-containing protein n=1 Tax=Sphingomonas oligophenolica TaxID=301154 RepID=A0ABU9Y3D0_9SPHN
MANELVKDEIDAQSGRFEFLKQALTLGLAGLAGTAAFFTDTSKIPVDTWSIWTIIVMGIALLTTVAMSLMGISVYANLLKAISTGDAPDDFRGSLISHARSVFLAISATALAFVIYAGAQLANHKAPASMTSAEAIGVARRAIVAGGCETTFETLTYRSNSISAAFDSHSCHRHYVVALDRKGGEIASISSVPTP